MEKKGQGKDGKYEPFISILESDRAEYNKNVDLTIANLRKLAGTNTSSIGSHLPTDPQKHHKGQPPAISSDTFFGKTFIEAVIDYLGMVGSKQTTRQIVDAVRAGGISVTDGSASVLLRKKALEKKELASVGRAEWCLMEWYKK